VPGQKTIIVSDYSSVIQRVDELLRLLDSEAAVQIEFVRLKEADARDVATTVTQLLATRQANQSAATSNALITADDRLNQVIVAAPADQMKEILQLVSGLDKGVDLQTKVYPLKAIGPTASIVLSRIFSAARPSAAIRPPPTAKPDHWSSPPHRKSTNASHSFSASWMCPHRRSRARFVSIASRTPRRSMSWRRLPVCKPKQALKAFAPTNRVMKFQQVRPARALLERIA